MEDIDKLLQDVVFTLSKGVLTIRSIEFFMVDELNAILSRYGKVVFEENVTVANTTSCSVIEFPEKAEVTFKSRLHLMPDVTIKELPKGGVLSLNGGELKTSGDIVDTTIISEFPLIIDFMGRSAIIKKSNIRVDSLTIREIGALSIKESAIFVFGEERQLDFATPSEPVISMENSMISAPFIKRIPPIIGEKGVHIDFEKLQGIVFLVEESEIELNVIWGGTGFFRGEIPGDVIVWLKEKSASLEFLRNALMGEVRIKDFEKILAQEWEASMKRLLVEYDLGNLGQEIIQLYH